MCEEKNPVKFWSSTKLGEGTGSDKCLHALINQSIQNNSLGFPKRQILLRLWYIASLAPSPLSLWASWSLTDTSRWPLSPLPLKCMPRAFCCQEFGSNFFFERWGWGACIKSGGHFSHFGGTKNGTSGARIKIPRPLFNKN